MDNPEVTPQGQWIILITDKGLVFSIDINIIFSLPLACTILVPVCDIIPECCDDREGMRYVILDYYTLDCLAKVATMPKMYLTC